MILKDGPDLKDVAKVTDPITIVLPELEGDAATPETTVETTEATPAQDSPEAAIAEIKKQLEAERAAVKEEIAKRERAERERTESDRRRIEAERLAVGNAHKAAEASDREEVARYDSIVSALSTAQTQAQQLQAQATKAMADGDWENVSKYNSELAQVGAKIVNLEDGKRAVEDGRKNRPQQETQQQQPRESIEQFYARPWNNGEAEQVMATMPPATASWLRNNPRYFSDTKFRSKVQGAHQIAVGEDLAPNSDAYFKRVEEIVMPKKAEEPTVTISSVQPRQGAEPAAAAPTTQAAQTQARQSPAPAAAPPSRTVPGAAPAKGTAVSLTAEERQTARILFPKSLIGKDKDPEVLYAQHKAQLEREGKKF